MSAALRHPRLPKGRRDKGRSESRRARNDFAAAAAAAGGGRGVLR